MTLANKVTQFGSDADIMHQIVHGPAGTTVVTESGNVPTIAQLVANYQAAASQQSNALLKSGGTMTGDLAMSGSARVLPLAASSYTSVAGIGNASVISIDLGQSAVPVSQPSFLPAMRQMSVITGYGYRQNIVWGTYRDGANGYGGGAFIAMGNVDANPTQYYLFGMGGALSHSSGVISTPGQLAVTGSAFFGGFFAAYNGAYAAATITYTGATTQYGLVLKPVSDAGSTAIAFMPSTATTAAGSVLASIRQLAANAGMNLVGTWYLNGYAIATSAPGAVLVKPTITGYIETLQALNPGAAVTVDPVAGTLIEIQVSANITVTLPAAVAGMSYLLILVYQGAYTVTFAGGTSLTWTNQTVPKATSVSGRKDLYSFVCGTGYTIGRDGGRNA